MDGDIAELATLVAGIAGSKKANGQPFRLTDFCNWAPPPPEEEATIEEAFLMFKALAGPKHG